ncbi:MAG: hypothetical protein GY891_04775 [Bacteroidetes bacterium]|nr:hypothetical protein [Bacteroidota bacterium]
MKNIYWILILISYQSFSQNEQWFEYKLDSLVSFQLPAENANLFDSEENNVKMYELSARLNEVAYAGNKIKVEEDGLPNSLDELRKLYADLEDNALKSYSYAKISNKEIKNNGFIGLKTIVVDSIDNRLYESEIYLLDNQLFLFNCFSKDDNFIKDSDYFFSKISLPKNSGIEQLTGKSNFRKLISLFKTELLILMGIVILIVGIILIKKNYLQQRL